MPFALRPSQPMADACPGSSLRVRSTIAISAPSGGFERRRLVGEHPAPGNAAVGAERVEQRESLVDLDAGPSSLSPDPYGNDIAIAAGLEDVQRVDPNAFPRIPRFVPKTLHVVAAAVHAAVGKSLRRVELGVLAVHLRHLVDSPVVP